MIVECDRLCTIRSAGVFQFQYPSTPVKLDELLQSTGMVNNFTARPQIAGGANGGLSKPVRLVRDRYTRF